MHSKVQVVEVKQPAEDAPLSMEFADDLLTFGGPPGGDGRGWFMKIERRPPWETRCTTRPLARPRPCA